MNDLERELRDLLADDAQHVPTPDRAPESLRRRAHLRQAAFATLTGLSVVAVVALAVVALSALPSRDAGLPADQPTTTQALNGITITHPATWHLIDPDEAGLNGGRPTKDLPRLILALSPQPQGEYLGCPGLVEGEPPSFLMTVQERPLSLTGDAAAPWPVSLEPMPIESAGTGCYPSWSFLNATWTSEGRTFEAVVGLAQDVNADDREALLATFASMTFEPTTGGATSVVLATGVAGGEEWELIATRQVDGLSLSLQGESFGTGTGGFGDLPPEQIHLVEHVFGAGSQAERVVFGAIPADAVRVAGIDASTETEIPVLDVPDEIDARMNAFVVTLPPDVLMRFEAYDAQDRVVAHGTLGLEPDGPTPSGEVLLEDGRHFGYIRSVDPDRRTIDFDLAIWLTGEEANRAYQEATGDTGPVPNDYYVVNDNPKLRTLPLAPDLRLRLLDWNDCCDSFFDGDLALFAEAIRTADFVIDADDHRYDGRSQWWVTVADGVVTEIEEQYTP